MSDYTEFFLNAGGGIVGLDCLEISHSNFSQTWYLVRNSIDGVTVIHEDASTHEYVYCPMKVAPSGSRADLDHKITFTLGDVGDIIQAELDAIVAGSGFGERPVVNYRAYRSDDLTQPMYGPVRLEVVDLSCNHEGFSFEAQAPSLNVTKTGELYTLDRFPMLRGFL